VTFEGRELKAVEVENYRRQTKTGYPGVSWASLDDW